MRSQSTQTISKLVFALKRCRRRPVCANVAPTNTLADWLGGGQGKRSASICSSKRDAGDFARLLFSSAERSASERAGLLQTTAWSHLRLDRVSNRGRGVTGTVRYRVFSARCFTALKTNNGFNRFHGKPLKTAHLNFFITKHLAEARC